MEDVKPANAGRRGPAQTPCLCAALRQASRALSRVYDAGLRGTGLRSTQYSLLKLLSRVGEIRQGDLGSMASLDETTLTRNLRPLEKSGWIKTRAGADRREKLISITDSGLKKLDEAAPAWSRVQERIKHTLPDETWDALFKALPALSRAIADLDAADRDGRA